MMPDKRILIVADQLEKNLGDPEWRIIDCRFDLANSAAGRASYDESHLPGAVFLDLDKDLAGPVTQESGRHPLPDVDTIAGRLGELGIGNDNKVVVYDGGNGAIAARAWWVLRWLGHDDVFLLDGGFTHWQSLGLPTERTAPVVRSTDFLPKVRQELVLTTEELAGNVSGIGEFNLLDARDARRFRGEQEPIDPVAGHIPGSISLPFASFLRADGTWRPLDERRRLLADVLGADREAAWSVMCGSGVTACHLAISGLEAGYTEPRVYVGSWSEWIRDPERPIGVCGR